MMDQEVELKDDLYNQLTLIKRIAPFYLKRASSVEVLADELARRLYSIGYRKGICG